MSFAERFVEADGFRIRYMEAGQGTPLVHLHGAGGLRLNPAHELLARHFRVIAFEMPGFGTSPENARTRSMPELASTMGVAIKNLGVDVFDLMGTSFGGKTALWLALQAPERVRALVLEAPAGTKLSEPKYATAVIQRAKKGRVSPWLLGLLARKPKKLAAVALANKMARVIWAMMVSGAVYRRPQEA